MYWHGETSLSEWPQNEYKPEDSRQVVRLYGQEALILIKKA